MRAHGIGEMLIFSRLRRAVLLETIQDSFKPYDFRELLIGTVSKPGSYSHASQHRGSGQAQAAASERASAARQFPRKCGQILPLLVAEFPKAGSKAHGAQLLTLVLICDKGSSRKKSTMSGRLLR